MTDTSVAFARTEMLPQQEPPAGQSGEPYLQMVQAQPLTRQAPNSRGEMQLSFAPVAARAGHALDK